MTDIHHKKAEQAVRKAEQNRNKARQKLLQQREVGRTTKKEPRAIRKGTRSY